MIDLRGKVALVTGSSRGIGRACALRLAQAGADVIVNYLSRRQQAEEVAGSILALGRRSAVVKADVGQPDDVRSLAEYIRESFGRLDILISNAAAGGFRPLLANDLQQFHAAMSTNVEAFLHLLRELLPLLQAGGGQAGAEPRRGKVVVISSLGSRFALPYYGLVGMTKAAVESLARQAALEHGAHLNVNVLVGGAVDTEALQAHPESARLLGASRGLCGKRTLTAEEIADAALFLASPLADLIQGQTLVVDGGASIALS